MHLATVSARNNDGIDSFMKKYHGESAGVIEHGKRRMYYFDDPDNADAFAAASKGQNFVERVTVQHGYEG